LQTQLRLQRERGTDLTVTLHVPPELGGPVPLVGRWLPPVLRTAVPETAIDEDGYLRDRNVFTDGISIEDDMAVLVRYHTGATLSYHLTAYSPWEGYRIGFNGTRGRLELDVVERSYVSGDVIDPNAPGTEQPKDLHDRARLTLRPLWDKPQPIEIEDEGSGGHGGGDRRLLADVFGARADSDPLGRAAGHVDGAYAMLTGAAANRSFATGLPVQVEDLVTFPKPQPTSGR
jgi:hypothetical protein